MKYRLLTEEELEEMKPEFIQFLISHSITADDWVKIKEESPEKSMKLIEIFSDLVLENVLGKITFIEYREEKSLMAFHCQEEKMVLLGLNVNGEANLRDEQFIAAVNKDKSILQGLDFK